jgi:hypothetical protein
MHPTVEGLVRWLVDPSSIHPGVGPNQMRKAAAAAGARSDEHHSIFSFHRSGRWSNGRLKGTNNKLGGLKRTAYGFTTASTSIEVCCCAPTGAVSHCHVNRTRGTKMIPPSGPTNGARSPTDQEPPTRSFGSRQTRSFRPALIPYDFALARLTFAVAQRPLQPLR